MVIKKISLQNFRNYRKKSFEFSPGKNLIIGPNAVGKTNLLEAIYLLASGKSLRAGVETEMISYGEEMARVTGVVNEEKIGLEIILTTGEVMGQKVGKKKYLTNGVSKRAYDFVGNFRAVYFGPEDLELVTDSPSIRRKYLDAVLSQTDPEYTRAVLSYEKGLRSRNKILEEMKETGITDRRRLYFWDQLLIKNGNIISERREEFLNFLNSMAETQTRNGYIVEYDRSTISAERLKQYEDVEISAGMTLVGPHRDDFVMQIYRSSSGEKELSAYGSRGEQRLGILWLKQGELKFVREKTLTLPVLLLDDIFSELDREHREFVVNSVGEEGQVIVTSADIEMLEKGFFEEVNVISI